MINPNTILSTNNDKLTLLQWLIKVDKALQNDTLQAVEVVRIDTTHIKLKFVFKDEQFIESDEIEISGGGEVTIEQLEALIEGSETIIFDRDEMQNKLQIRLDNDIIAKLARVLVMPLSLVTEKTLVGIDETNSQSMFKFGEGLQIEGSTSPYTIKASGGSSKQYKHQLKAVFNDFDFFTEIYSSDPTPITIATCPAFLNWTRPVTAAFSVILVVIPYNNEILPGQFQWELVATCVFHGGPFQGDTYNTTTPIVDTVTEL